MHIYITALTTYSINFMKNEFHKKHLPLKFQNTHIYKTHNKNKHKLKASFKHRLNATIFVNGKL